MSFFRQKSCSQCHFPASLRCQEPLELPRARFFLDALCVQCFCECSNAARCESGLKGLLDSPGLPWQVRGLYWSPRSVDPRILLSIVIDKLSRAALVFAQGACEVLWNLCRCSRFRLRSFCGGPEVLWNLCGFGCPSVRGAPWLQKCLGYSSTESCARFWLS